MPDEIDLKKYDMDKDGKISTEEIEKLHRIKRSNNKYMMLRDQSRMAWFALICMGLYPFLIILSSALGFDSAAKLMSDITGVYFGSIAVVVAAYMGSEAYAVRRDEEQ